jgi:hypothetical protein
MGKGVREIENRCMAKGSQGKGVGEMGKVCMGKGMGCMRIPH